MKALPWSQLARQRLLLEEKFAAQYAHDWLVWEAGAGLVIGGNRLPAGVSAPLAPGAQIELGNVVLTFRSAAALAQRLG